MAIEQKRGCGYRKVGGLYMVGGELSAPCDRLAWELSTCPCCGEGIKQSRGWTWIDPIKLFGGDHVPAETFDGQALGEGTVARDPGCSCDPFCPVCFPTVHFKNSRAGLIWIGESFYKTPHDFLSEGMAQGVSRRISAIPRGFVLGSTWVFFAHPKAVDTTKNIFDEGDPLRPGIISAFRPSRLERIVLQSEYDLYGTAIDLHEHEEAKRGQDVDFKKWAKNAFTGDQWEIISRLHGDASRSITLVPVPDDDRDHNPPK